MQQFVLTKKFVELGLGSTRVLVVNGIARVESPAWLDGLIAVSVRLAHERTESAVASHPHVSGLRALYAALGHAELKPASQKLIELVRKRKVFPRISAAVDAYNTVVVDSMIGIGAHDLNRVVGRVRFELADREASFKCLGREKPRKVLIGDFLYRDDNQILAHLASFDSEDAKITHETKDVLLVAESTAHVTGAEVEDALEKAGELICRATGATGFHLLVPAMETE